LTGILRPLCQVILDQSFDEKDGRIMDVVVHPREMCVFITYFIILCRSINLNFM